MIEPTVHVSHITLSRKLFTITQRLLSTGVGGTTIKVPITNVLNKITMNILKKQIQCSVTESLNNRLRLIPGLCFVFTIVIFFHYFNPFISNFFDLSEDISPFFQAIFVILTYSFQLAIILILSVKYLFLDIKGLLLKSVLFKEILICAIIGFVYGIPRFFIAIKYEYQLIDGFLIFIPLSFIVKSILWPLIEEILFRGICFSALRQKGRAIAFVGSSFLFTIAHSDSFTNLVLRGAVGINTVQFCYFFLSGLLLAYIYESTGKLSLAIVVHGIINSTQYIGAIIGYAIIYH